MPVLKTDNIAINYLQLPYEGPAEYLRNGEPEDLVMIHGLATNMAFWYLNIAPALAKRYRVTLFDLRGHGRSSMTESGYRPEQLSGDLKLLLDHLQIDRIHVVAHSFGALVALRFGLQNPDRIASLVLADSHIAEVRHLQGGSPWDCADRVQTILDSNHIQLTADDPYFGYRLLKVLAKKQIAGDVLSDELKEIINPLMNKAGKRTAKQWVKLLETTQAEQELMSDDGLSLQALRTLKFPILALYGERSQALATGKKLLWVWPHARFHMIKGEGHFFPASKPDRVLAECRTFWNRQRLAPVVVRKDSDRQPNYFRSNRFECVDGQWYFSTREGTQEGPFADLAEAKNRLAEYIAQHAVLTTESA